MKILFTVLCLSICLSSFSQIKDIDKKEYKTIEIDKEVWLLENLNVSYYNNGDTIPQVQDSSKWANLKTGAWCYYEWEEGDHKVKGKLYNSYAIEDKRGLLPDGFEMPIDWSDWGNVSKWLHEGRESWESDSPEKIKIFMGEDLESTDCHKNKSYYRYGDGQFGTIPSIGFWWLPSDNIDMTYYISRCSGMDGAYFDDFEKDNWKNYGFFIRCYKKK